MLVKDADKIEEAQKELKEPKVAHKAVPSKAEKGNPDRCRIATQMLFPFPNYTPFPKPGEGFNSFTYAPEIASQCSSLLKEEDEIPKQSRCLRLNSQRILYRAVYRNSGRISEGIKGLKRKKVVAQNHLKKVPKSPVKKPQSKKSTSPTASTSSKKATPSSFSGSPSHGLAEPRDDEDAQQEASTSRAVKVEHVDLSITETQVQIHTSAAAEQSVAEPKRTDSFCGNNQNTSNTSDPLDVLLKAMEPDFNKLAERKSSLIGHLVKSVSTPVTFSNYAVTMPPVNTHLDQKPSFVPTFNTTKQFYSNVASTMQQTHMCVSRNRLQDKPGFQKSCSVGPSFTLMHAPVPLGSGSFPQSQPPIVQTCQSLSATVPNSIQVPVTPGFSPVQMTTVVNIATSQVPEISPKDQKPKKQGKYVCEYCNRACAKPSVLLKHIRSHTGERPYPCVTCGFSFKTKSNLYKHKKSHAHATKLGLVKDSGSCSLSQESDKGLTTHSDVEESGDSEEDGSAADLDADSSQSSLAAFSESSLQGLGILPESDQLVQFETVKPLRGCEPKAALPKVVVHPVNVSPLRADSPRATDAAPEQATAQRQREFQPANLRANVTVLSSLKEVDCTSPPQESVSEDEDCKSPLGSHAQLQRQQATDYTQQSQIKCLLSPRSLGSTDSGYFSRSESADQAMSPPSPFVKITPPAETDIPKPLHVLPTTVLATVMHVAPVEKCRVSVGQMRPPLETKALSLEERISKLISDNEAVVDDKQLDSVKPRRTSLSRRGSIDSPKSYIFKDSFQFDLKIPVRRSSSNSDIPKSPFTPTDKSKQVFLLSVPPQYPSMECLPITRSNSMPTTPGNSALFPNATTQPHQLRICHSFDEKFGSLSDEVFSSSPSTPNLAIHPRTLVRQIAVEDFSTNDGHVLISVHSMDESHHGPSITNELRSKSFEHATERCRKPQQNKGTMYECETCRNRYRKLENFENHKKFYCSELHGPKNKPMQAREMDQEVFARVQLPLASNRNATTAGTPEQPLLFRKRRKIKSVGDDDDQSPTEITPPCSRSFDSCQSTIGQTNVQQTQFPSHSATIGQIQVLGRSGELQETRLSTICEAQISTTRQERGDLQRQGSGTSVIRHTNSLSRPNSFETSESLDRISPVDLGENDINSSLKSHSETVASTSQSYYDKISPSKCQSRMESKEKQTTTTVENIPPVQQLRLVRQNNIQVPEILVTEEPDRDLESQATELTEKPAETFNWPQRSESLSKLPSEKLPPKKKRIRLAQMEHSSGESSFESSLSRSLSRDSSLSRCSSVSASFDRDDPPRSDSPSKADGVGKSPETQGAPIANNTLGVPGMMRRSTSEQISCTQSSVDFSCEYRSKSFDCSSVSPSRPLSPMHVALPKTSQCPNSQVPLIERRRGPLVRQMSLKIGPDPQMTVKQTPIQRASFTKECPGTQSRSIQLNTTASAQSLAIHSIEALHIKNDQMIQSINLGSKLKQPQVHGLPHPWHQSSRVFASHAQLARTGVAQTDIKKTPENKNFVPKYQMTCQMLKMGHATSLAGPQGTQFTLPATSIPTPNESKVSKDGMKNVYNAQSSFQTVISKPPVLPTGPHMPPVSIPLPQILITHEHTLASTVSKACFTAKHVFINSNSKTGPEMQPLKQPGSAEIQNFRTTDATQSTESVALSLGSLHCTQKLASANLCPQESTASSKRMLSPANSLDIAMEKTQKRAKDEHGAACLTDARSLNYLNSKMSELTRQRKLMLVRQVCTTEPVDSPIETDAPEQLPETSQATTNTQTSVTKEAITEVNEHEMESRTPNVTPTSQSCTIPENSNLKLQEKPEEQRWSLSKSPLRPPTFHGQVKLASSVSVVNTRDSHRLSFPSLKTATTYTWCFLMKRKPLHLQQTDHKTSAYSAWTVNPNNPNPLSLPTKVVMSLFDSKQTSKKINYTQAKTTTLKSDILTYSGKLKDIVPKVLIQQRSRSTEKSGKTKPDTHPVNQSESDRDASKSEPQRVKIFDGGFKSNEEYVYVRGRGRGKYICEECGIRCKKPSMLRKHIRTHSDIRPFHCTHCNFSFKTKGNLTKHMKSKAHSKKCLEMGVAVGFIEDQDAEDSGDRGRTGSSDRQDSDADDSEGPDDEDNDGEEEDEEDSQAESGLSATPSVSASPQHLSAPQTDTAPSSLLAQMSISPNPAPPSSDTAMTSPVSLVRQMSISACCSSPGPNMTSFTSFPTPASETHGSDTDSVHMMSPVSPCRQMSIDFDVPPSPPVQNKGAKLGQEEVPQSAGDSNANVDRGTQTSSDPLQGHFTTAGALHEDRGATHLFSHLPLHSQQPLRSPYSMVPVGGIQLVSAGLAAYSTFVPIQAGPVQLTIPALSVIHRQTSSPIPNTSPHPESSPTQPLVVQEPVGGVLPCFPLGQVAGLQTLGAHQSALQPLGLETLSVVGLANSTQLVPQPLNATLGVQVLAASPTPQCTSAQIPGLQILNIALPALIPSLSPLSALSPLPAAHPQSPERVASITPQVQGTESPPASQEDPGNAKPSAEVKIVNPSTPPRDTEKVKTKRSCNVSGEVKVQQTVTDDYNEASSDDEDRLVIAT
ncbi:hypothetical protein DNTS_032715 [Danionella cerebrum]|uniref:Zinc finger protein 40 n=1 Tax=Danionella cerebrum TaxID=2873325 RepID=A0A553Q7P3_9TELE|nr:hypothetical protein DNTS_032715 [Danionella translucida]